MKKIIGIVCATCMLFPLTACESPQQRQYNYENTPHTETSGSDNKQYVTILTSGRTIEIESFSGYSSSERVVIKFKNPEVFTRTVMNADGLYETVEYSYSKHIKI